MTKAEIISIIKNTLLKVDEQGRFREPLIERHISAVHEQMFNELYSTNPKDISKYTNLETELVSTSVNLASGRTIPVLPIDLPRVGGGLFEFYIGAKTFVITTYEGYKGASSSLFDTANFKGQYLAAVLNDKIYANTTTGDAATLTYRMIPKITEVALTDEVKIPGGAEDHFIDRVIATMQQIVPTDLINDNTIQ